VVEAEVEESPEVDGGDAGGQADAVAFDASVADSPVVVGDEPGDGAFDHGPVLAVVLDTGPAAHAGSGGGEELVVVADALKVLPSTAEVQR
jgi:hypothetical protein